VLTATKVEHHEGNFGLEPFHLRRERVGVAEEERPLQLEDRDALPLCAQDVFLRRGVDPTDGCAVAR
jgi:hypothetical protein